MNIRPNTGIHNRRRLDSDLSSLSPDDQVAYITIDVDHLTTFNEINGHAAGDDAIQTVLEIVKTSVRHGDVLYRSGGGTFCVLLPGATAEEAVVVAERARRAVETAPIPGRESQPDGRVTISVGVSESAWSTPAELPAHADNALAAAKRAGRNCVVLSNPFDSTN